MSELSSGATVTVDRKYNRFSRSLFSKMTQQEGKVGEYWTNAWEFWHKVKSKPIDQISPPQLAWLGKIEHDLVEKAKERDNGRHD